MQLTSDDFRAHTLDWKSLLSIWSGLSCKRSLIHSYRCWFAFSCPIFESGHRIEHLYIYIWKLFLLNTIYVLLCLLIHVLIPCLIQSIHHTSLSVAAVNGIKFPCYMSAQSESRLPVDHITYTISIMTNGFVSAATLLTWTFHYTLNIYNGIASLCLNLLYAVSQYMNEFIFLIQRNI